MKDKITKEEYNELFAKDKDRCYINLIIPAMNGYPEMNLIGKKPEDYSIEEIAHSKTYRRIMREKIIEI